MEDDLPGNVPWCHLVSRAHNGRHVYKCSCCHGDLFFTAFKQCEVQQEIDYEATTRQLVVGLGQLEQLSQTPLFMNLDTIQRTIFRGTLDTDQLLLASFTVRVEGCDLGLVAWRPTAAASGEAADVDNFTEDATMLTREINSSPPAKEPPCRR